MSLDPAMVATILAVGGIGVTGITEMIKRLFKIKDKWAYVLSAVISISATLFVMLTGGMAIAIFPVLGYSFLVWLEANGIYKAVAKT